MRRWTKELLFDLREPGINIWILPIISAVFVVGTCLLQVELGNNNTMTLAMLEIVIPFMGGYASIMIMQGLLDTEGCEILFTYPRSYLYWGILRESRLFVVQAIHVAIISRCLSEIMQISFWEIFALTLFQSFAYPVNRPRLVTGRLIIRYNLEIHCFEYLFGLYVFSHRSHTPSMLPLPKIIYPQKSYSNGSD